MIRSLYFQELEVLHDNPLAEYIADQAPPDN